MLLDNKFSKIVHLGASNHENFCTISFHAPGYMPIVHSLGKHEIDSLSIRRCRMAPLDQFEFPVSRSPGQQTLTLTRHANCGGLFAFGEGQMVGLCRDHCFGVPKSEDKRPIQGVV